MPKHMTIINLACTITKLRKWGQAWKYSAESAQNAASQLTVEHERKLTEHRAAFGARTEADAKIIAGLREERDRWKSACSDQSALLGVINAALGISAGDNVCGEIDRLQKERDALRAEVAELKTQLERLTSWAAKNQSARETLQTEIERLKSQTPKHPVKVGEWVKRLNPIVLGSGTIAKVLSINENDRPPTYTVEHIDGNEEFWFISNCEPCDPPTEATHDTEAGKAAAGAAIKNESVVDEIKVGDLVEVVSNRGRNTWLAEVGSFGTVTSVEEINDSISVHLDDVPGKQNVLAGYVSFCDVRKVTT